MTGLKKWIGAGLGSGYIPTAPGTAGSFLALFFIYPILYISPYVGMALFVLVCSILSLWVTDTCVAAWGDDPGKMVMDEFAGQSLVFIGVSLHHSLFFDLMVLITGFILFRLFDIIKPFGINRLQRIEGAAGILLDDILAGFYAFLCLKTLILLVPIFFTA